MIRISVPWLIDTVDIIDALDDISETDTIAQILPKVFGAQVRLYMCIAQSSYSPFLKVSSVRAVELHSYLEEIIVKSPNQSVPIDKYTVAQIKVKKKDFMGVFLAEVGAMPVYVVSPKEGYDTDKIIGDGACLFPSALVSKVPEAKQDAMEAGKALAFELATACGFHVFRVTECVVRRYWDQISGNAERPNPRTIANFVSEMEKKSIGDPKIIEALKQLTRLHRNPVAHPEAILSTEEAIGIIGIARSVIGAILSVLAEVPVTTGVFPSLSV